MNSKANQGHCRSQ